MQKHDDIKVLCALGNYKYEISCSLNAKFIDKVSGRAAGMIERDLVLKGMESYAKKQRKIIFLISLKFFSGLFFSTSLPLTVYLESKAYCPRKGGVFDSAENKEVTA